MIDPTRQEVTLKLHWVPFDDPDEPLVRVLSEFGDVKEIRREEWRVPGFALPDSTTRIVRMTLHDGVVPDALPELFEYGEGAVLCVVPGRAPTCLRCGMRGHIRRDCATPQCAKCRRFGHVRQDCIRTYANVAGNRRGNEVHQNLMDQEEAERAATGDPSTTTGERSGNDDKGSSAAGAANIETAPKIAVPPEKAQQPDGEDGTKEQEGVTSVEEEAKGSEEDCVLSASESGEEVAMDATQASAKRPHDAGEGAVAAQRLRRLENEWKVVAGRKKKLGSLSQRSTSLTREGKPDDGGSG